MDCAFYRSNSCAFFDFAEGDVIPTPRSILIPGDFLFYAVYYNCCRVVIPSVERNTVICKVGIHINGVIGYILSRGCCGFLCKNNCLFGYGRACADAFFCCRCFRFCFNRKCCIKCYICFIFRSFFGFLRSSSGFVLGRLLCGIIAFGYLRAFVGAFSLLSESGQ